MVIGLYNQGLKVYYKRAMAFSSHPVIFWIKIKRKKEKPLITSVENAISAQLRSFHRAYQSIKRTDPFAFQVTTSQTSFRYFKMPCLRFLRRLLGKGGHHHRDHDQNNSSAVILQLPLDLLLLITDQLALHDKFLLSHTCKTLRQVTCQDWAIEVSQLSFEDQIGFWAGLAYTLPNHWACLKCCQLHPLDTSDVPRAYWAISARDVPCTVDMARGVEIEAYSVQHYHVQFALKLSRLGNIHRRYLKALMKPYTCTRKSPIPPLRESYTAAQDY